MRQTGGQSNVEKASKKVGGLTSRSKYSLSLPYFATTGLADLHTADALRHTAGFRCYRNFIVAMPCMPCCQLGRKDRT